MWLAELCHISCYGSSTLKDLRMTFSLEVSLWLAASSSCGSLPVKVPSQTLLLLCWRSILWSPCILTNRALRTRTWHFTQDKASNSPVRGSNSTLPLFQALYVHGNGWLLFAEVFFSMYSQSKVNFSLKDVFPWRPS